MGYEPCGSKKLDGSDLLARIAVELGVTTQDLYTALVTLVTELKEEKVNG